MSSFSNRQFNNINVIFCLLIVVCLVVIGYLSFGDTSNGGLSYSKVAKLSDSVYPNINTASLNADLGLIATALSREARDQKIASRALTISTSNGSLAQVISGSSATNWLDLLDAQTTLLTQVNVTEAATLQHQIKVLKVINTPISATTLANIAQRITEMKVADDQAVSEILLSDITSKLNAAVIAARLSGDNGTDMQADLTTIAQDAAAGYDLSQGAEIVLFNDKFNQPQLTLNLASAKLDILAADNAAKTVIGYLGGD